MKKLRTALPLTLTLFLLLLWLAASVSGQGLATAGPQEVGLSSERLTRIDKLVQNSVDEELISGAVALIARQGKVAYLKSFGFMDEAIKQQVCCSVERRLAMMTRIG